MDFLMIIFISKFMKAKMNLDTENLKHKTSCFIPKHNIIFRAKENIYSALTEEFKC